NSAHVRRPGPGVDKRHRDLPDPELDLPPAAAALARKRGEAGELTQEVVLPLRLLHCHTPRDERPLPVNFAHLFVADRHLREFRTKMAVEKTNYGPKQLPFGICCP